MTIGYDNNKRWRKKHPEKWLLSKRKYYKQFQKNVCNNNQIWSLFDIAIVTGKFDSDRNLSKQLGRSVGAIQSLRGRLKRRISNANNKNGM